MKTFCASLGLAAALAFSTSASAAVIGYANAGTENSATYNLVAASTGKVTAYFMASDAGYENELTLYVNGKATGVYGLNNHKSEAGAILDFGSVNVGDKLVFALRTLKPSNVLPVYSDSALNADGLQHIYSTSFAGSGTIPAGTYVGFEDMFKGGDFDYNDENFVFTNVAVQAEVPEPASLALLFAGAIGIGASRKARAKRKA